MQHSATITIGPGSMESFRKTKWPSPAETENRNDSWKGAQRYRRILVTVNLSEGTYETLRCSLALAGRTDAVLDLLHVIQLNIAGEEQGIPRASLIRQMSEAAKLELRKLVDTLLDGDVVSTISVKEGRPDEVILREAGATRADLIIMGGRKRSLWSRLFNPSVLKRVLRRSECPVMVVG